jgi:uncharacterized protein (TIGR02680 family)
MIEDQPAAVRPALPEPLRTRWQPLRMGLVELFRYDSEEFWFRDGHLLLRGNNGTGKSKLLSLVLPLLFDANLRPARVEPDGDGGKRMAWNLLLGGAYERRTGYSWIEFGRLGDDGQPVYLTLGVGLHAAATRSQVDAWYFIVDGPTRLGRDLWLLTPQRQVMGRDRLREALLGLGQVFADNSAGYRRAVDERLFQLGERRYGALMDTLIQLRQPQLSRRPDEGALSAALTEALAPLAPELLSVVAEAMTQLEQERQQLDELQRLCDAVQRFEQRYRVYAGIASRRQARVLRRAQTEFDNASRQRHAASTEEAEARTAETAAQLRHDNAVQMLAGARRRLDTLLEDPLNQDANRLETAAREARDAENEVLAASRAEAQAREQAERAGTRVQEARDRNGTAGVALQRARREAIALADETGLTADLAASSSASQAIETLQATASEESERAALSRLPGQRREHLALLRRRLASVTAAEQTRQSRRQGLMERQAEAEDAAAASAEVDVQVESEAAEHLQAWSHHGLTLTALQLDTPALLEILAAWLQHREGEHPARRALHRAQGEASRRLAERRQALATEAAALAAEQQSLGVERSSLQAGVNAIPQPPAWRAEGTRDGQPGAALWQLIDFDAALTVAERTGLEAALQAAGLLDAWVTPDGQLLHGKDGQAWLDGQWRRRPAAPGTRLSRFLHATPDNPALTALLDAVLCSDQDRPDAEAWVALDGRFRVAGLAGAHRKDEAQFIGHAARAAARARRLAEIESRLHDLEGEAQRIESEVRLADAVEQRIAQEWLTAPSEQALLRAEEAAAARGRELQVARRRCAEADTAARLADAAAQAAQDLLAQDAADLRLPASADGLERVDALLHRLSDALHTLSAAVRELQAAWGAVLQQAELETEALARSTAATERTAAAATRHERARSTLAALEATHGQPVQVLRQRILDARRLVERVETALTRHTTAYRAASEGRARAEQRHEAAAARFERCDAERTQAVTGLRRFAATGLLASGLAGTEPAPTWPSPAEEWTIDPALGLARRTEQLLATLDDSDERWQQAQQQVAQDLQELQRSLSALHQLAVAEPTDFGFVVRIHWHNRAEQPEQLAALLAADLADRRALLSAREREVLENHLQAEIAAEIQRLMRAAAQQVEVINRELQRRPTSTGVRFRLLWQPLSEAEGAPAGLEAARDRLLRSRAELWSADDRRVLGALLQQRIADERGHGDEGSLLEQLSRALDYRHWHRFRVERLQDGQWRKLSGPASSGERALGLTVPLFAAVASFYQGSPHAPRLMLLDEAFAGIDDAARAHCMALVREFDLDFVITSEREWGCYAELPGVAICQLQRREGIDAVFVSRWAWDGRARHPEADPARRLPPAD